MVIMRRHFFWWEGITRKAGFSPWLYSFVYNRNKWGQKLKFILLEEQSYDLKLAVFVTVTLKVI